jgi:RHS repeat-associated protein
VDADGDEDFDSERFFAYDGNQVVLEFDGDSAADLTRRYLWGPAVDQILADERATSLAAPEDILWPLTDHLHTTRDLAEYDSLGEETAIASHRVFDSFGNLISESDDTVTTLLGFTARPFDVATGLQWNLNRWYVSTLGVWLSEDPIGFDGADTNLTRYVGNTPTAYIDHDGLAKIYFEFNAFIEGRIGVANPEGIPGAALPGTWFDEPGGWAYWVATDNRGFGGGSSRMYFRGWVESCSIGSDEGLEYSAEIGSYDSERVRPNSTRTGYLPVERKKSEPDTAQIQQFGGQTGASVWGKGSGRYGFSWWFYYVQPSVNFDVRFSFDVVDTNRVEVSVSGTHDSFPSYEALVSLTPGTGPEGALTVAGGASSLYSFSTGYSGPGVVSLAVDPGQIFGGKAKVLNVKTSI